MTRRIKRSLTHSISTLTLAILLLVPCTARAQTAPPRSFDQTRATVQAFIDAYNRHDISGVLATVQPPDHYWYADCDYLWHETYSVKGRAAFIQNLRDRFAENDLLQVTRIWEGADTSGLSPLVFGLEGTRTNDPIVVQGLAPPYFGAKGWVDPATGRIIGFVAANQSACHEHDFPWNKPSALRTRTITQDFLDAYAAHDSGRILQLVSSTVSYTDYSYARCQPVTVTGRPALKRWLRRRFAESDHFDTPMIRLPSAANLNLAEVRTTRASRSITDRQLAPQATRITLTLRRRNENFTGPFYRIVRADIIPAARPASCARAAR